MKLLPLEYEWKEEKALENRQHLPQALRAIGWINNKAVEGGRDMRVLLAPPYLPFYLNLVLCPYRVCNSQITLCSKYRISELPGRRVLTCKALHVGQSEDWSRGFPVLYLFSVSDKCQVITTTLIFHSVD